MLRNKRGLKRTFEIFWIRLNFVKHLRIKISETLCFFANFYSWYLLPLKTNFPWFGEVCLDIRYNKTYIERWSSLSNTQRQLLLLEKVPFIALKKFTWSYLYKKYLRTHNPRMVTYNKFLHVCDSSVANLFAALVKKVLDTPIKKTTTKKRNKIVFVSEFMYLFCSGIYIR